MISDIVSMPLLRATSLSDVVYKKTSGNALFVTQFLWSLWDEGLLFFSLKHNTWQWNTDAIEVKKILDDVGVLMSQKILQLPIECQRVVKLLSCIGSNCDESTLKLFMTEMNGVQRAMNAQNSKKSAKSDDWLSMLDFAVDEGLLKKEESNYKFAHDQIQHAAYSSIPKDQQGHLHKQIGTLILEHLTDDNCDVLLFMIVDQMNRGQQNIENEVDRVGLAMLNLRAGEKSKSLATFLNSASYLRTGIDLLCESHWEKYYDLSLQLYSWYAEAEYCNGHFQEVGQATAVVIEHAKTFDGKFRVYATLIKSLAAQNKVLEAIGIGFNVLMQLGVQCPSPPPDKAVVMRDTMEITHALKKTTGSEFLKNPVMNDKKIVTAMKFLQILLMYTYLSKQEYLPIIITQMMQLTIRYGICKESCVSLAFLSYLLCEFHDFDTADHIGQLSILLLEKFEADEYLCQVYMLYFTGAACWKAHIKLSLDKRLHGYKVGMQTGDIETAMFTALIYLIDSFIAGRSLEELDRELDLFGKQMIEYKQNVVAHFILVLRQLVSSLVSSTHNDSLMVGQDEEQKVYLAQAIEKENAKLANIIYLFGGVEAYMFGKHELAAEMVQKRQKLETQLSRRSIFFGFTDFYDGLIFLAMAYKTNDAKWTSGVDKAILNLKNFVLTEKVNCENKLLLLQAETNSLAGQKEMASRNYELAIAAAERNDFIHEHAIALERAGDFFLRNGDDRANQHYGKAHELYVRWGAQGKADHLAKNLPF